MGQPPVRRSGRAGWPRPGRLRPRCVLQKWQCVEDASGKLKLHKCKGPARPGGRALSNLVPKYYAQGSEACVCDSGDEQLSLSGRRKKLFKKSTQDGRGGDRRGRDHTGAARLVHSDKSTSTPLLSMHPSQGAESNKEGR